MELHVETIFRMRIPKTKDTEEEHGIEFYAPWRVCCQKQNRNSCQLQPESLGWDKKKSLSLLNLVVKDRELRQYSEGSNSKDLHIVHCSNIITAMADYAKRPEVTVSTMVRAKCIGYVRCRWIWYEGHKKCIYFNENSHYYIDIRIRSKKRLNMPGSITLLLTCLACRGKYTIHPVKVSVHSHHKSMPKLWK